MQKLITIFFLVLIVPVWASNEPTQDALERWFESDEMVVPEVDKISEGELRFLSQPPQKRTTSISNEIHIDSNSLNTGWVSIDQCYDELDPIAAVEVVYRYHNMRQLKILSTRKIKQAWVEGQSVQLKQVEKGATLCVSLQAQIFYKQDNRFALRNGPFERRFLDGYYPLHVMLNVSFPPDQLRFVNSKPVATTGFNISKRPDSIEIDTWFEGKLTTELTFEMLND